MNIDYNLNSTITFNAGLTYAIKQEIKHCDVSRISEHIEKHGIANDFKNNNMIAWCSLKCIQLIQEMNRKFHLELGLPKGIFVEDFGQLRSINENSYGFTNFAPTYLYKKSNIIVPEKTIFFNKFSDKNYNQDDFEWNDIDSIADKNYVDGISATDFFLEIFLHEFTHVIHEENLINKLGGQKLILFLRKIQEPQNLCFFQSKFQDVLKQVCVYATTNPLETVACDMSKRIINSIHKDQLRPNANFMKTSPYQEQNPIINFLINIASKNKLNKIISNIWNGNIELT